MLPKSRTNDFGLAVGSSRRNSDKSCAATPSSLWSLMHDKVTCCSLRRLLTTYQYLTPITNLIPWSFGLRLCLLLGSTHALK